MTKWKYEYHVNKIVITNIALEYNYPGVHIDEPQGDLRKIHYGKY